MNFVDIEALVNHSLFAGVVFIPSDLLNMTNSDYSQPMRRLFVLMEFVSNKVLNIDRWS